MLIRLPERRVHIRSEPAWAPPPRARRAWRSGPSCRASARRSAARSERRSALSQAAWLERDWRSHRSDRRRRVLAREYRHRKYYDSALDYDRDFAPAYRYGWESFSQFGHRAPEDIEDQLQADWKEHRGRAGWNGIRAQHAVHDAWSRIQSIHARDRNDPNSQGSHHSTAHSLSR